MVFVMEEYMEEDDLNGSTTPKQSRTSTADSDKDERRTTTDECWKTDTNIIPIELCVKCSDFEANALHASYCSLSGYYDRLNCTYVGGGAIGLRPCISKGVYAQSRFNVFMACMTLMTLISTAIVQWRQSVLDRRAFARVQQQLGGV